MGYHEALAFLCRCLKQGLPTSAKRLKDVKGGRPLLVVGGRLHWRCDNTYWVLDD